MRWGLFARPCISRGLRCIAIWQCRMDNQHLQGGKPESSSPDEAQRVGRSRFAEVFVPMGGYPQNR